jgi:endoglucanase
MTMRQLFILGLLLFSYSVNGQTISKYIVVDQFGYRPTAKKVAVIRDPAIGYDAAESYTPGATYALVNSVTTAQVFTAAPTIWQTGNIDTTAGDRAWWFDFSSVTTPGSYYVLDVSNNTRSYTFEIRDDIYNIVLKHAFRTFFYQRAGYAKQLPYADAGWVDGASHLGPLQDKNARYYLTPNDASTEKDVHGGWYDAGDFNKYTTWTAGYIGSMLIAYEETPTAWTDDFNIPESGNGIPDILDEAKWGLKHLLRLQNVDGSLISLVGMAHASPPSAGTSPSLYGNVTTASTLKAAAAYAYASKIFRKIGLPCFADSLQTAAIKAWDWAEANPSVMWNNSGTGIGAGEQEVGNYTRLMFKLEAAEHLFTITNDVKYRDFFDNNYQNAHLIQWWFVFPYEHYEQEVMLYYTSIPNATAGVVSAIQSRYLTGINAANNFGAYDSKKSSYLAHLDSYVWGSNNIHSMQGLEFYEMVKYNINPARNTDAMTAAENYIHYIHGVNPLRQCYLSNMNNYGADKSVTQFFHSWFSNGSPTWDQVGVSTYGPAPGFLVGGANASYAMDGCCPGNCGSTGNNALCTNPATLNAIGQPPMKSFADVNEVWPANSWSITENSNGYQTSYVRLLSKFVKPNGVAMPNSNLSCIALAVNVINFDAFLDEHNKAQLYWIIKSEIDTYYCEVERSLDGINFKTLSKVTPFQGGNSYTDSSVIHGTNYYRIKIIDKEGKSSYTDIKTVSVGYDSFKVFPNPSSDHLKVSGIPGMKKFEISIVEPTGKEILKSQSAETNELSIDVSPIPAGLYFIIIKTSDHQEVQTFIKN